MPGARGEDESPGPNGNAGETPPAGTPADPDAVPPLPDEEEVALPLNLPAAGLRYVYAANPEGNSVVVIDSETLGLQAVEAGDRPTFVQALPERDAAVALNVRSDDATIVRTTDGVSNTATVPVVHGSNAIAVAPDGRHAVVYYDATRREGGAAGSFQDVSILFLEASEERSVAMTVGFRPSSVAFSADGERAFVVTEDGISIVELAAVAERGSHIARTVALATAGEPPVTDVSITPDGRYALARLEGQGIVRWVDLERQGATPQTLDLRQVFLTPEGEASDDSSQIVDAGAESGTSSDASAAAVAKPDAAAAGDAGDGGSVGDAGALGDAGDAGGPLGDNDGGSGASEAGSSAPPTNTSGTATATGDDTSAPEGDPLAMTEITDLDLTTDGSLAIAVVRGRRAALMVPIPEALEDLSAVERVMVPGEIVGSVGIAPNATRALLYTTAVEDYERVTILDMESATARPVRLPKSVLAVRVAPDGQTALLVHRKLAGDPNEPGIDTETLIDRSHGYSVLDLQTGFSKLEPTQTTLALSASVPDGSYMFLAFNEPSLGVREVHRVELRSFLVQEIPLASPPISLGSVPGTNQAFVGQEHADGRITFIDWQSGSTHSVTGFELNSRIRE